MKFGEKLYNVIVFICSIPLVLLHMVVHVIESVQLKSDRFKDKLFMKRFRFIDDKHIDDYIKWCNKYIEDRKKSDR